MYVYIYILVLACACTCTDECGSDVKVDPIVKLIGRKFESQDLSQTQTKCRHDRPSWHYLGVPFTIRGWTWTNICKDGIMKRGHWSNFGQRGHYRR